LCCRRRGERFQEKLYFFGLFLEVATLRFVQGLVEKLDCAPL
jgi:hypothetical protein